MCQQLYGTRLFSEWMVVRPFRSLSTPWSLEREWVAVHDLFFGNILPTLRHSNYKLQFIPAKHPPFYPMRKNPIQKLSAYKHPLRSNQQISGPSPVNLMNP